MKLPFSTNIKSLGVIIDSRLSFDLQVNAIARACNYHIWAPRHIRRLITVDIAKTLVCSIVGARLDYCNSLLNGTSNKHCHFTETAELAGTRCSSDATVCTHNSVVALTALVAH